MKKLFNIEDMQVCRKKSGIYFLFNDKEEIVYIGKSGNVYTRILEHIVGEEKDFKRFNFVEIKNETLYEILEVLLISITIPKYNKLIVNNYKEWLFTLPTIARTVPLGNLESLSNNFSVSEISKAILDLAINSKSIEIEIKDDIPDIF